MQVSFSTGTFYHRSVGYSLRLARETGYDGVELAVGPDCVYRGLEPIQRDLAAYGVPVLSVHPPFLPLPGWPRRLSPGVPRLAAIALELGAGQIVVHTPFLAGEHTPRAERYSQGLRTGHEIAGAAVEICLESSQYNQRKQRYYLDDLENLASFAASRGCGVTLDTCHAGANGEDILACYEQVRPVLRSVHLSDVAYRNGKAHTHVLPGEGDLPLDRLLGMLARDGYDGLITLEIHPLQVGLVGYATHVRRMRQALEFVRAAIAQPAGQTQTG